MSTFDRESNWVDDELRRVPMPDGLIARLRAIAVADDNQLDEALRDLPIPASLLSKLHRIVEWEDQHIDAELLDVPIPSSLLAGLTSIPAYEDPHLDAGLRDVGLPADLAKRLTQIPHQTEIAVHERAQARRRAIWQMVTAASLLLMIGGSYFTAIAAFVSSAYRPAREAAWTLLIQQSPSDQELQQPDAEVDLAVAGTSAKDATDRDMAERIEWDDANPLLASTDTPGSAVKPREWFDNPANVAAMLNDISRMRSPFSAPAGSDADAALEVVSEIVPQGVAPKWSDADDLLFQLRYGVHPFQSPLKGSPACLSEIPLSATTASYDWARQWLQQSETEAYDRKEIERELSERVRTEHFIQAIDYGLSPPAHEPISLRVFGGPSPFLGQDMKMLQVLVQAADRVSHDERRAHHLTLLLDVSSSMKTSGALDRVRKALLDHVETLGPRDRLSLIAHSETAEVLIEDAGSADLDAIRAAIDSIEVHSGNNVGEGLRLASGLMQAPAHPDAARSLVLITDGVGLMTQRTMRVVEQMLAAISNQDAEVTFVQVGRKHVPDPQLLRLVDAASGTVVEVDTAQQIQWAVTDAVAGQAQVVAEDARLTVEFNPEAVAEYRLLGHEASSAVGLVEAPIEVNLRTGQTSVGVFELKLKPYAENLIGWAEVSWRKPGSTFRDKLRLPISRLQMAPTFAEAPMPMQAAIVAAESAELLRGSPFAARPQASLDAVRRLAAEVDPQIAATPSFERFVRFLDRAIALGLR